MIILMNLPRIPDFPDFSLPLGFVTCFLFQTLVLQKGMVWAWISLMWVNPISSMPCSVGSEARGARDLKDLSDKIPNPIDEPGNWEEMSSSPGFSSASFNTSSVSSLKALV